MGRKYAQGAPAKQILMAEAQRMRAFEDWMRNPEDYIAAEDAMAAAAERDLHMKEHSLGRLVAAKAFVMHNA